MSDLIHEIFRQARIRNLSKARLADKAGVRPETLSRLKHRENFDMRTLSSLALAVGCRLALVPLELGEDAVFSPRENARAKAKSRRLDEEMIELRLASREEVQRRNAFFAFPNAQFRIKPLTPKKS